MTKIGIGQLFFLIFVEHTYIFCFKYEKASLQYCKKNDSYWFYVIFSEIATKKEHEIGSCAVFFFSGLINLALFHSCIQYNDQLYD